MKRRVLLVETLNADKHRHHRAEVYPYVLGFARDQGAEAEWWVIRVPAESMHSGGRFVVDLPAERVALLAEEAAAWRPDVIAFHDLPSAEISAALMAASPETRIADLTQTDAWITDHDVDKLLGPVGADPELPEEPSYLLDTTAPCFERRFLEPEEAKGEMQPLRLLSATSCFYRRAVADSPPYRELDTEITRAYRGCAYCPNVMKDLRKESEEPPFHTPAFERALKQVEAHQQAAPAQTGGLRGGRFASETPLRGEFRTETPCFEYHVEDAGVHDKLPAFLDTLMERGIRASTFYTVIRADTFLRMRDDLEATLARMQEEGHRLRLLSMGAESFSAAENERYNKGLTPEQLWQSFEAITELSERFADTFAVEDFGYFATILFSPWTLPEDLKANIDAARRLGPGWLQRAVGTRLQLWEDAAITELARHDGLLAGDLGSTGDIAAVCISDPHGREIPWRFRDPRTELIFKLLIRLDPIPEQALFADEDELAEELRRLRARLPAEIAGDYVRLAGALVDAVETLGAEAEPEEIFAHVAPLSDEPTEAFYTGREDSGPGDAVPGELRAFHARLLGMLRAVYERGPERMRGYRLVGDELGMDREAPWCLLRFSRDGSDFGLRLELKRPGRRGWKVGKRCVLTHDPDTPPAGEDEERLARLVLAAAERCAPA